jgi:uncharacterized SAM-dependent methyltransferase
MNGASSASSGSSGSSSSSSTSSSIGGGSKVIMWLGSSVGNCGREEAGAFLRQIQQQAMGPGDVLLLGIDRRNEPAKVAAAYNDAQGAWLLQLCERQVHAPDG